MSAVITTTVKGETRYQQVALDLAERLQAPYIVRHKQSIQTILTRQKVDAVWVVGNRLEVHTGVEHPFFFHPGMAVTRIKRLERGEQDPLIRIGKVQKGDSVLDCTLGLAADAIVLAYAVGATGQVFGLESNPWIALLVEDGLRQGYPEFPVLDAAMQRIMVRSSEHTQFLQQLPDRSVDIVYFDPMFRETVVSSSGILGLHTLADPHPLSEAAVREATRVAKKRVILKERYHSTEFARLGFQRVGGGATSIAYGFIDCENEST